jgi:hypothetical protein
MKQEVWKFNFLYVLDEWAREPCVCEHWLAPLAGKSGSKAVFILCIWTITHFTDVETSFTMLPVMCISIKLLFTNWSSTVHIREFENNCAVKLHSYISWWRPPPSTRLSSITFVGCLSCHAHTVTFTSQPLQHSVFVTLPTYVLVWSALPSSLEVSLVC